MDRVVLRAPTTSGRGVPPSPSPPSSAAATVVAVAVLAAALAVRLGRDDDDDTPTTPTMPVAMIVCATMSTMAAILVARMASSSLRLLRRCRRRSLVEAAVEISPLGAQLVSVYGIPSSTAPGVGEDATSSSSGDCCYPGCEGDVRRVVHAFLPRSSIIDVVVVEVVWPHCVWSQVVFRVLDDNGPDDDDYDDDGSASSGDRPVRNLLRKGRVIVVPAFHPHECRGMMTYEQCLRVRDEMEGLLGKFE